MNTGPMVDQGRARRTAARSLVDLDNLKLALTDSHINSEIQVYYIPKDDFVAMGGTPEDWATRFGDRHVELFGE